MPQLLIWFMEDFMSDPFSFMDALQNHTGVPYLDYRGEGALSPCLECRCPRSTV